MVAFKSYREATTKCDDGNFEGRVIEEDCVLLSSGDIRVLREIIRAACQGFSNRYRARRWAEDQAAAFRQRG